MCFIYIDFVLLSWKGRHRKIADDTFVLLFLIKSFRLILMDILYFKYFYLLCNILYE